MKPDWSITSEGEDFLKRCPGKKVMSVVETKSINIINWSGELDGEDYFLVSFISGILMASYGEREMMLKSELKSIAYIEEINEAAGKNLQKLEFFTKISNISKNVIPLIMQDFKFEDVAKFLKWKFNPKKVKVYETEY